MFVNLLSSLSVLALAAPVAAEGSTGAAVPSVADDPQEIIVTGQRREYGVKQTATATKTRTEVKDIPQAMTVISESQIEDQGLRSVAELLQYVPGAMAGTGEMNRDQMTLRGNNSTADFFLDGVRDDAQYFRDFYNLDRVEVLKGPNAMIFGRGGGGGIVNRVTKRASLGAFRELLASGDRFGGFRLTGDIDQPLGGNVGVRLNGLYEDGDSFRRHTDLKRYGVNPTLAWQIAESTRLDLAYEYFHDRRTTDRGVVSVTDPTRLDRPVEGENRTFFGDPDDSFARADVHNLSLALEHMLADGLTLRHRTQFADYDKFYQNIYPTNLDEATDEVVLGAYNSRNDRRNLFAQTDLIWESKLGGIDQTLLLGFELGRQAGRNQRLSGSFAGSNRVPLSDPTRDLNVTYAAAPSDADNRARATILSAYVQDQVRPADWLELVAGVRYDEFKLEIDDLRPAVNREFARTDRLWSPRLGVVVKPTARLSVYGSLSRSYLPQSGDQFSGLTSTSDSLKPERFDNIEVGAKWEPLPGLLATAALYQLDRENTQARDSLDRVVLTGAQRSRGLELGLERSISNRWQVAAGYTYQKAEISRTTAAAPEGREVPLVPRHSASLWTRYQVDKSLGLGIGMTARSRVFASIGNQVVLPGYAKFDAAAYYKLGKGIEAQLNLENIFDRDYFASAHNDNNIAPGAPRTLKGTLRFGF